MIGAPKEFMIRFVLGYDPAELSQTLRHLSDGKLGFMQITLWPQCRGCFFEGTRGGDLLDY